jgi:hypothetical protein
MEKWTEAQQKKAIQDYKDSKTKTKISPLGTQARSTQANAMAMAMKRLEAERKVFEKKYGHQPSDAELIKFRTTG